MLLNRRGLVALLVCGGCGSDPAPATDAATDRSAPQDATTQDAVATDAGGNDASANDAGGYFTEDPRHVHLNWSDDPTTTIAVLWATAASAAPGDVQYGSSPTMLTQRAAATVQTVGTTAFGMVTVHEAHLTGLTPDTTYHYRVGTEGHLSETFHFRTAPMQGARSDVNFIVSGDSRDDMNVWRSIQQRAMAVMAPATPDFEIFTGDAVLLGAVQSGWNAWFDASRETLANLPWIMVHGNHEALSVNYLAQFAQPAMPGGELYFSLNYGPVHILVLNDSTMGGIPDLVMSAQVDFMQRDLMAVDRARTPWVVVTHHKSAYSSSSHGNEEDPLTIRRVWAPIYDRFHVDMVFNGHDHDLEVSRSMRANAPVAENMGTVYVVSGGAGAGLYPANTSAFTRVSERTQNFLTVHATRTSFDMTPYRADGTVVMQGVVHLTRPATP